ncbi:DUF5686 and carboxypeptidase regulatory-like domain-containing protein [Adhaeribacter aquaticus]|uniref:DUF5686 and carboxypeptidase regulatory-like domain-containing protein n=1 Tax=Adhaeribacter aquaticus TaxID=299567 RepID=UPI00040752C7|nr:DUF5686 and carboxypeptidase regulatory-like domain-containing protein [Adhaeribacter aquaticus]
MLKYFLLILCVAVALGAHAAVVKGRVLDEKGEPLPFATLYVRNTTTGTASNEQGYYQLTLTPGTYQLVFQYVGYKAKIEEIEIGIADVVRDVTLQLDVYNLNAIEINANDKDPAYAIVKAAIGRRKYHLQEALAYTCRVYTKGLGRLTEVPNRVMGIKVNDLKTGIVYLSETVSEISFRQPNRIHERMVSSKVSGDQRGFSFNRASRVNLNFYENLLRAQGLSERAFVSPLAGNAMLYYRYKLIGATQEHGKFINKIKVTPIRRNDPAFEGYIYIVEDEWRLHSLDLKLTKAHQIEYVDTVRVQQTFGEMPEGIWMLLNQKITLQFDSFGFKGNGYFTTVYSNYKVQPTYPKNTTPTPAVVIPTTPGLIDEAADTRIAAQKKIFKRQQKAKADALYNKQKLKNEVMAVEKDANKHDSAYWAEIRPVPLTLEEQKDYVVKDSIQVIQESKAYKDSVDKKANKFEVGSLFLGGYRYRNSYQNYYVTLNPLVAIPQGASILQYNTVEGPVINLGVRYHKIKYAESEQGFEIAPTIRYGFANEKLQAKVGGRYRYNPHKFGDISAEGGRFVSQFNPTDPISSTWNSLYTLLGEQNYMKLYQRNFASVTNRIEVVNGFFLSTGLEYADRLPLENAHDYKFKDFENRQFTSNFPVNAELNKTFFPRHQALIGTVTLQYRPGQKYIMRPEEKWRLESKSPTFRLNYTKGFSAIFGSDVNYDQLAFNISDRLDFKLLGRSNYSVQVGAFLNKKQLHFMDYKHFSGNRTVYAGNFGGFQLLNYYLYSTTNRYLEAHFSHEFNGFIINKIPLLRKLKWQEVATVNYLNTRHSNHYLEIGFGIEHIFKIFRVDFISSFQSKEKIGSGFRIGFGF